MYIRQHTLPATPSRGVAIILVIVFTGVFMMSVSAIMAFIFMQSQVGNEKAVREKSFNIAEAGLSYYHWFLAHFPNDMQDGTGGAGPYTHTYKDPSTGKVLGSYTLTIQPNKVCGQVQSVDITSKGVSALDSRYTRTLVGRHAAPSVAEYAYIIGADVWAGGGRSITGPYHSNGGIRMDGNNNSLVTSAVAQWTCNASFGCSPAQTKNGIFGSGNGSALWQYPSAPINFQKMITNFTTLKGYAQSSGIYLAPYGSTTVNYYGYPAAVDGYHLKFNADGTVDIYRVTSTYGLWGYRTSTGWIPVFHIIASESFVERRNVPSACSLIFVEDKTWIDGVIKGKVTVVAATVANNGNEGNGYVPDVILNNNITYATQNGADGLTVISAGNIFIPPQSPNDLTLNGIFIAQGGEFGREYFPGDIKNKLTVHGSIISLKRVGTNWICGGNQFCSGYAVRDSSYDRLQTTNPPPFTPTATTTPRYISWQEQ